jgi:hypothetical protein
MDIVLQGPLNHYALEIACHYLTCSFVDSIIMSCWTTCPDLNIPDHRISVVRSEDVPHPGIGNRNRQIRSSLAGVLAANGPLVAKMRSDQKVTIESMEKMWRFFNKFKEPQLTYLDKSGPQCQLFVAGTFWPFPFHPRDHIFWGHKEDLVKLFNIPHCSSPMPPDEQYHLYVRAEAYIGARYCAHFHPDVQKFVDNPTEYLVDNAPQHAEAQKVSIEIRDKVFKVFPRINFAWPKHNMPNYHYHVTQCIEYWHDQPWE